MDKYLALRQGRAVRPYLVEDVKVIVEEYAALGKKYMKSLVNETVSLGIAADMGFSRDFLKKTLKAMDEQSILEFKSVFSKKVNEKYPIVFQLDKKQNAEKKFSDEEFII